MISWIQNALEKKGRIIFIILLAVIVVSFVFVIGETPGCVSAAPGMQAREYYGYDLNSEADTRGLVQEVVISSIVNRGQRPQSAQMLEQEFLSRAALLYLADRVGIPAPTQQAFVSFLAEIPFFQDANGRFDPNRVTSFLDMSQLSRQFDEATINRALTNDFRIRQLMESIAPPGYTVPFDIEEQTRRMDASYTLSIARLAEDSVELTFDPSEDEIETFFSQRVEAYRIPETRILALATFRPAAFAGKVPDPSETELRQFFDNNRTRYVDEEAEDPTKALPDFETVRDEVLQDWKEAQGERLARQSAEEFVYTLFDEEIGMLDPKLDETAQRFGVTLEVLEPMVGVNPPPAANLPEEAVAEAARLDSLRYFSDPFETGDSVSVLLLREVQPTYIPELSDVRSQVLQDLEDARKQEAFVEKGEELRESLAEAVASGTPFPEAARTLGLDVETFEDVRWENLPDNLAPGTIRRAESLPSDTVSPMVVTGETGSFLFVDSRSAPVFAEDSESYAETKRFLASDNSRRFVSSFVSDLVQSGLARADSSAAR